MRVLIIGAGIAGLCTAWALRRRGAAVVVLEAGPMPNANGFSAWPAPVADPWQPHLAAARPAAAAALGAWVDIALDVDARLLAGVGVLALGLEQVPAQPDPITGAEPLIVVEARRRCRALAIEADERVAATPSGGLLRADVALAALTAELRAQGAEIHQRTAVARLNFEGAGVETVAGTRFDADWVIVTAGAGTRALWPDLAAGWSLAHRPVDFLLAPDSSADIWDAAPVVMDAAAPGGVVHIARMPADVGNLALIGPVGGQTRPWHAVSRRFRSPETYLLRSALDLPCLSLGDARIGLRHTGQLVGLALDPEAGFFLAPLAGQAIADLVYGETTSEEIASLFG